MEKNKDSNGQKYSIWKAFILSFYSKDLYSDVGEKWKGSGYGFLFLLVVLFSLPRAIGVQWQATTQLPGFVEKIPDFKLEKGIFSSSVQQPFKFEIQRTGLTIDTTGKVKSLRDIPNLENMDNYFLVNKTKASIHRNRLGDVEDKTYDLAKVDSFSIDRVKLKHWSDAIIPWVGIVYYPLLVIFWFAFEAIAILIYGLFGIVFSEMRGKGLNYNVALRLSVVSHIPGIFFFTILAIFDVNLPMPYLFYLLVSGTVLFFAVNSQRRPQPPPLQA